MTKFIEIIKVLLAKWKLWIFFPILAVVLVFYLTKDLPRVYTSNATVHVNLQTNSDLSLSGQAIKQYEIGMYFQNLLELLKSRSTFEYVRLKALKDYVQKKHQLFDLEKPEGGTYDLDSIRILTLIDSCLENKGILNLSQPEQAVVIQFLESNGMSNKALNSMIKGYRLGNSYFLKIETKTDGAFKSKYFADLFSEALIFYHINLSRERISKDRQIMEELVRQAKLKLDMKVKALEEFKIKNTIINLGELTKAIVNQTVDMEIALAKIEEKEAAKRQGMLEIEKNFKKKGAPLPLSLDKNEKVIELKSKLREVHRAEITNAFKEQKDLPLDSLALFTEQVKKDIQQNIKHTISEVPYDPAMTRQDLVSRYIGLQLEAEMAKEIMPIVKAEIQRLKVYANSFAPLESAIGTFDREINTSEQSYLILLNKLNLTKTVEQGTGINELTINDEAFLPIKPEASKRLFMLAGAGLAVFVVIIAFIVVIELLDRSIGAVSQFEASTQIPMIAAFPNANDKRVEPNSQLANSIKLLVREQVKNLREKVMAIPEGNRTFLLTSTYESEGKTWIAQSLSRKLIDSGYSVLMIQADWFGKSEVVTELKSLGNHFTHLESVTESGCIQANHQNDSPFDFATQMKWKQTLSDLKMKYDFIFVIPPPLSICSDWQEWATILDNSIHVFKANKTFRAVDQRAEKALLDCKLNKVGSVFNRVNIERMEGYIGDVPKLRSKFRKLVKRWAYGGFKKAA
ncbi:Wzz/FepE/Etk N-terminal domain-containing protein [Flammeovirgaceae bacterium SG7u.111]|nr:Wzz/FepE/Etk N-terminal domain-containing protein [Flammeovirgaceae bacterium SG7u.132]WPO34555.1 Wzz/FepE/Etk N-terminal domain-containing protein [Flammeovirgaceae bacterium SG7u.111]